MMHDDDPSAPNRSPGSYDESPSDDQRASSDADFLRAFMSKVHTGMPAPSVEDWAKFKDICRRLERMDERPAREHAHPLTMIGRHTVPSEPEPNTMPASDYLLTRLAETYRWPSVVVQEVPNFDALEEGTVVHLTRPTPEGVESMMYSVEVLYPGSHRAKLKKI